MTKTDNTKKMIEEIMEKAHIVVAKQEDLSKVVPAIEAANSNISDASKALKNHTEEIGKSLGDTVTAMIPVLKQLQEVLKDYNPASISENVTEVNSQLKTYNERFEDSLKTAEDIFGRQKEITKILPAIESETTAVSDASKNLKQLVDKYEKSYKSLADTAAGITKAVAKLEKAEPAKLTSELKEINTQLSKITSTIQDVSQKAKQREEKHQTKIKQDIAAIKKQLKEVSDVQKSGIVGKIFGKGRKKK